MVKDCPVCFRSFSLGQKRRSHERKEHPELFVIDCFTCNRSFKEERSRVQHVNDKPCPKPGLDKRFLTQFSNVHLRQPSQISLLHTLSSSDDLEEFVDQHIQPDTEYLDSTRTCVNKLVNYFQHNIPEEYRPAEVLKGGSLKKGTAIDSKSDIDLTLFLNPEKFKSVVQVHDNIGVILEEIKSHLMKYCSNCRVSGTSTKSIQIVMDCGSGHQHEVDILPACKLDLSSQRKIKNVFQEMSHHTKEVQEFYVPSLSPLQLDFIKSESPTKLKTLIRLVKYWKSTCLDEVKQPSSLLLELIAMDQWKRAGEPENFNLRKGFYSVINAVANYKTLTAIWPEYYSKKFAKSQGHVAPYILDPNNPYRNLVDKYNDWENLSKKAKETLKQQLFDDKPLKRSKNWSSF